MTTPVLPANDRFVDLSPSAGATELDYDFELKSETGLTVIRVRAGARATLVNGTDYDFLSGLGTTAGGTITLSTASLAGDRYVLIGREPIERATDLLDSQAYRATRLNEEGDLQIILHQEARRDIDRALKVDYGAAELKPIPEPFPGRLLIANDDGDGWENGPDASEIAGAQLNAEATAADREQTGLDRIQTGLDRLAAAASATLAQEAHDRIDDLEPEIDAIDDRLVTAESEIDALESAYVLVDARVTTAETNSATALSLASSTEASRLEVLGSQTLALPTNTYSNGTAGVGATITASANGLLSNSVFDGATLEVGSRVFVALEGAKNGLYTVTALGSGAAPYVLTRATDTDTAAEIGLCRFKVTAGATLAGASYQCQQASGDITVGTTALTFAMIETPSSSRPLTLAQKLALEDDKILDYARRRKWPVLPIAGSVADPAIQPQRLTVTRTGTVTVINRSGNFEAVPVNQVGHDYDPLTGEYLGWRLEHTATNLFLRSQDQDNAYWSKTGVSSAADATLSWRGLTLRKYLETATSGIHGIERQNYSVTLNLPLWVSLFVKADQITKVAIGFFGGGFAATRLAKFNLEAGAVISTDTDITTAGIEPMGGDVWLIWASAKPTATVATSTNIGVYGLDASNDVSYTGDTGDGFYCGEFQLDNYSSVPNGRIPTTSAGVARGQTVAQTGLYTLPEGAFQVEFVPAYEDTSSRRLASFFGDANNRIHILNSGTTIYAGGYLNGTSFSLSIGYKTTPRKPMRVVLSWKKGRQILAIDGNAVENTSVNTTYSGTGKLIVGQDFSGGNSQHNMWLRSMLLFDRALSRAEAVQMSAPDGYDPGDTLDTVALEPWVGVPKPDSVRIIADFPTPRADVVAEVSRTTTRVSSIARSSGSTAMTFSSSPTATVTRDMVGGFGEKIHTVDISVALPDPDFQYFIRLKSQGRATPWIPFRTPPAEGDPGSHNVVIGSCTQTPGMDLLGFGKAVKQINPNFVVHLGDTVYADPKTDDLSVLRQVLERRMAQTACMADLLRSTPMTTTKSNHDYVALGSESVNDINGTFASTGKTFTEVTTAARTAWAERVPHSELLDSSLTSQKITWGRFRYLLIDTVALRDLTEPTLLGNSGSTYDQLQRIKDEMVQAGADGIKLLMICMQDPITSSLWYSTNAAELAELLDYAAETDDVPAILWVAGDAHQMKRDDGTYTAAETATGSRMAHLTTSAINSQAHYYLSGDEWRGFYGGFAPRDSQFMNLILTDNGGDDVSWRAQFYASPYHKDRATLIADFSMKDVTPEISFDAGTDTASTGVDIDLDISRTWNAVPGGTAVTWTDDRGNTGTVTLRPNQNKATITVPSKATAGTVTVTLSAPVRCALGATTTCVVTVS